MITKLRPRYYCEFCGKVGGAKGHMAKHERRCTLNPNRECGVCRMMGWEQKPIAELIAMLPVDFTERIEDEYGVSIDVDSEKVNAALPALYAACNQCPACIMAALRQAGIPIPATSFNFKAMMEYVWAEVHDANERIDYGYGGGYS